MKKITVKYGEPVGICIFEKVKNDNSLVVFHELRSEELVHISENSPGKYDIIADRRWGDHYDAAVLHDGDSQFFRIDASIGLPANTIRGRLITKKKGERKEEGYEITIV